MILIGAGLTIGINIGKKVAVTELPQTVAAFHALVGLAAMATSIASFIAHGHPDTFHCIASFLGTFIGGVTLTGSIAAFIKLANLFKDKNLTLPFASIINKPLSLLTFLALASMI